MLKKYIFNLIIAVSFFFYGILTIHSQVFPYKILKGIKNKIYVKFSTISENSFNKNDQQLILSQQQYPNFGNKKRNLIKYSVEKNIWANRIYYNHKNDIKLLEFHLIRIKRHQEKDIKIKIKEDLIIYRPICEKNDNSIYNDWEKVNYEIAIIGGTCAHKKIVKKKFKKGYISLNPGGPIASDPIFIEGLSTLDSIIFK
jgi:hypothetical protein